MPAITHTFVAMDTIVTVKVIPSTASEADRLAGATRRAEHWFQYVEQICSRFDPDSEVMQLVEQAGQSVKVSPLLFSLLSFALEVARSTGGLFDPVLGHLQEQRGFNRNYRTGATISSPVPLQQQPTPDDLVLDSSDGTVMLRKPLVLDLGGVAKGLALDLAARELLNCSSNFAIEAGGDIYVQGQNEHGQPWQIGIQHPRNAQQLITLLQLSGMAIATSGDYERRTHPENNPEHHIVDPRTGHSPSAIASVSVIAPTAIVADALSTAAFLLDPQRGLQLLADHDVEGCIITADLDLFTTPGFDSFRVA